MKRQTLRPLKKAPKKFEAPTSLLLTPEKISRDGSAAEVESPTNVASEIKQNSNVETTPAHICAGRVLFQDNDDRGKIELLSEESKQFVDSRKKLLALNLATLKEWKHLALRSPSYRLLKHTAAHQVYGTSDTNVSVCPTFYRAHIQKHHDNPMPFNKMDWSCQKENDIATLSCAFTSRWYWAGWDDRDYIKAYRSTNRPSSIILSIKHKESERKKEVKDDTKATAPYPFFATAVYKRFISICLERSHHLKERLSMKEKACLTLKAQKQAIISKIRPTRPRPKKSILIPRDREEVDWNEHKFRLEDLATINNKRLPTPVRFDDEYSKNLLESWEEIVSVEPKKRSDSSDLGVELTSMKKITAEDFLFEVLARSVHGDSNDFSLTHRQDDVVLLHGHKTCEWRDSERGLDCDIVVCDGGAVWSSFEPGVIAADSSGISIQDFDVSIKEKSSASFEFSIDKEGVWSCFDIGVVSADDSGMSFEEASEMKFIRSSLQKGRTEMDTTIDSDIQVCWEKAGRNALSWEGAVACNSVPILRRSRLRSSSRKKLERDNATTMKISELNAHDLNVTDTRGGYGIGVWEKKENKYHELSYDLASGSKKPQLKLLKLRTSAKVMKRLVTLSARISTQNDGSSVTQARYLSHLVRFLETLELSQAHFERVIASESKVVQGPKSLPAQEVAVGAWPPLPSYCSKSIPSVNKLSPGLGEFDADAMLARLAEKTDCVHSRCLGTNAGKECMLNFLRSRANDYFQNPSPTKALEISTTPAQMASSEVNLGNEKDRWVGPTINADESRSSSTVSTLGSPIKKPINDVEAPEVNSTSRNETPVTNEVKVRKEKIQKGGCSACMVM